MHRLKPGVQINGTYIKHDVVLRQMLLPDIHAASGSKFFVFQQDSAPLHHAKDTVARCWIKRCPILSNLLSGHLTYRTSTWLTTLCGVCLRIESIVPRSRTSTNWNEESRASGPLWVTRLLNVLISNRVSINALAFLLQTDILSICCNKDDAIWHG